MENKNMAYTRNGILFRCKEKGNLKVNGWN